MNLVENLGYDKRLIYRVRALSRTKKIKIKNHAVDNIKKL